MPARKRWFEEVEEQQHDEPSQCASPFLLRLRDMWEFANLMQYIYLFGSVVKISNDVDIDALEMECCKPTPSELLSQIGLALLKYVSSHRGLTPDLFDEYTRRQYDAKAPNRPNPFGAEEEPLKFADFDVFLKIRVLHQLSVWTLYNPDRIRQALANENERSWYIEPFGWDSQDRTYYSLDDNRLYRMTDPSIPEPPQKMKKKKTSKPLPKKAKGSRSSKRQKLANGEASDGEADDDVDATPAPTEDDGQEEEQQDPGLGLGGSKWECVAITLKDYKDFAESIRRSKDPNEKELHKRMVEEMLPVIEDLAAAQERKAASRRRELENLQRLATAKRSSRIAGKHEKQKEQEEAEEAERQRREELAMARKEEEKKRKLEAARESRMITREQRLKDRETKRILHEDELARLEAQSQDGDSAEARISERRRKNEVEKKRRELEEWKEDDEEWYFDCSVCGVHGKNWDDGTHNLACEKCGVWQHSSCHGIKEEDAESDEFHFLCSTCLRPPKPIKLNIANESSPPEAKKKRKRQEAKPPQVNGMPSKEPKKRKKTPKAQRTHLNGSSPPILSPYESLMETDPSSVIPGLSHTSAPMPKPPFYPAHGHFAPPTNGHASRSPESEFFRNHNIHASNNSSDGPAAPSASSSSPHGNNMQQSNTSNITWQNYSPSNFSGMDPRSPHNPYLNDFGRQRIGPLTQHVATPHNLPRPQLSPPYSNFSTSRADPLQSSRHHAHHATQLTSIAASPTPSLSATQGSTNVHFSPMGYQSNSRGAADSVRSPNTNSYMPAVNNVNISAVSPTKQPSSPPPPLPHSSSRAHENAATGPSVPTFQSPPTIAKAGMSPVKQDAAPIIPHPPSNHGHDMSGMPLIGNNSAPAGTPTPPTKSNEPDSRTPAHSIASMSKHHSSYPNISAQTIPAAQPPIPTLSPNVGLSEGLPPPEKKDAPQPSAQFENSHAIQPLESPAHPPAPTLSPSVGLTSRVESPEKKELPKSPPLQPQQQQEAASANLSFLPSVPTLSPSVALGARVESPEKRELPRSPPLQPHRPHEATSSLSMTIPPAPTLLPSVSLGGGFDRAEKKEVTKSPSFQAQHSLEIDSVQPSTLPPAHTLSPSVGLSGGDETPEKSQVWHPSHQLNQSLKAISQHQTSAPPASTTSLNGNADDHTEKRADIGLIMKQHSETKTSSAQAPMPNGVTEATLQAQAGVPDSRVVEAQKTES